MHRRPAICLLALAVLATGSASAQPSAYPTKPIRLVVPFTPGGSTDILARAIGQELTKAWGQSVIVDNVPGAGGAIGADKVAKAAPDGYSLLMGHIGTLAVNPSLYPKLPYNPVKDFAPVAEVARVPNVLVVHPAVAAKNVQELVALAKAKPGQLNYGSGGNGSAANLATEYFKLQTGVAMVHIPYRGTAPAVTDLIGGQIQVLFTGAPAVIGHVKSGQLRALAVSSPKRLDALPDLPTVARSHGHQGLRGRPVVRRGGAGRHAARDHHQTQRPDQRSPEHPRAQSPPGQRRRGGHARHARGLRRAHRARDRPLEAGDHLGAGEGGLKQRSSPVF